MVVECWTWVQEDPSSNPDSANNAISAIICKYLAYHYWVSLMLFIRSFIVSGCID